MQEGLLPLFPLQVVLLPGTRIPLHIFEDRYKEMIGDAIRDESEFGIVLAADKGIVNMGCTATVEQVTQRYPDGRLDIVTLGRRRFEIVTLNDEKSYLRGMVMFFNDEEAEAPADDLKRQAMDGYLALQALTGDEPSSEPKWEDSQLSFQLAEGIDELAFRQQLLATRSEVQRLRRLADFFPTYIVRQKHVRHVRSVAPHNGHGQRPPAP